MVETHIPALASDQTDHIRSLLSYPASTPHLNPFNLVIRNDPACGRSVYASRAIPSNTLIEISPILLFPPAEYTLHGSKTQLDGYTFVWKRTEGGAAVMALALGLGSLFNHSKTPNVKWVLDHETHSIGYTTVREVGEGEELTISYGAGRMWWEEEGVEEKRRAEEERRREADAGEEVMRLARIGLDDGEDEGESDAQAVKGTQERVENGIEPNPPRAPDAFPPIHRLTSAVDPQTLPLLTTTAWIVDITPSSASSAVKFLQRHSAVLQNRDDSLHSTRHLRSFRTTSSRTQFLLCLAAAFPDRSRLVSWLTTQGAGIFGANPEPYQVDVPVIGAPTKQRLAEWQAVWPCIIRTNPRELRPGGGSVLLVDRASDVAMWADGARLKWAVNRFKRVVALARYARNKGGVASAVHVTHPYEVARNFRGGEEAKTWEEREGCDWSKLTGVDAPMVGRIRSDGVDRGDGSDVPETLGMSEAEWYAFNTNSKALYTAGTAGTIELDALDPRIRLRNPLKHAAIDAVARVSALRTIDRTPPPTTTPPSTRTSTSTAANGSDYLLTSLSLFTLYEPCVYCTMALLHSRVSEIYFLLPSPGRGGCCGSQLDPALQCQGGQDGGMYALQEQKGLNHSFTVWRWMSDELDGEKVAELKTELDIGRLDP